MKVRCFGVMPKDLEKYLDKNWRGYNSKDYELLISILLAKFHDSRFGQKHMIGLPMKVGKINEIENIYNETNIELIIKRYLEEDNPIDVFISPMQSLKDSFNNIGKGKGLAFQLKRVIEKKENDKTKTIIDFLNKKITNKYAPVEAGLVLIVDNENLKGNTTLNLSEIKRNFDHKKCPFQAVFIIAFDPHSTNITIFSEIYPNFGIKKFYFSKKVKFLKKLEKI